MCFMLNFQINIFDKVYLDLCAIGSRLILLIIVNAVAECCFTPHIFAPRQLCLVTVAMDGTVGARRQALLPNT